MNCGDGRSELQGMVGERVGYMSKGAEATPERYVRRLAFDSLTGRYAIVYLVVLKPLSGRQRLAGNC